VLDPEVHGWGVEMPSINPAYQGKEYRYVYACGAQRPCNFLNSLTKIDLVEKEAKN
jgi:carlactone synthase/all-trans-10'-apo-beta-carotenal 13,14-cleaving dioxygenase